MNMKKMMVLGITGGLVAFGLACSRQTAPPAQETPAPAAETALPAATAPATQTASFTIEGLHCGSCDTNVETAVTGVAGVTSCDSDHTKGSAVVTFDPNTTSTDAILAAIQSAPGMDGKAGAYKASLTPAPAAPAATPAAPAST